MAEESSAQPAPATNPSVFPVVLYDGDKETNYGYITIHSDLVYKEFQKKMTELIGISYNRLSTYLVENKKSNIPQPIWSERRKIVISGKVDFGVIVQEQNCYFLVVLKHSRNNRDRGRKHYNYRELMFQQAIHEVYPRVSNNVDPLFCLKCTVAQCQEIKAEFHCCVYDVIIKGFYRSRFGPIARPTR